MDSLSLHFFHKDGGRRSIAGIKERFERNSLKFDFLNFDPKNEIAFKFTRKSLVNSHPR